MKNKVISIIEKQQTPSSKPSIPIYEINRILDHPQINEIQLATPMIRIIKYFLSLLKTKDNATYDHSIRVGLYAMKIAEIDNLDPKILLAAGFLHDIGKLLVNSKTLKKTDGFNNKDMEEMEKHSINGYKMLQGLHKYIAQIIVRHHYFKDAEERYPAVLPELTTQIREKHKNLIDVYALLLSIADFYDAASTRVDHSFGIKRLLSSKEIEEKLFENYPDQKPLIEKLYTKNIFGVPLETLYKNDLLGVVFHRSQ